MKNLLAINGSPRHNKNTAQLLEYAMRGAKDACSEAELVNLYSLNFRGCSSCFACKLKGREHGICAMKDGLTPILEKIKQADAVIFGSPIYCMNLSSSMLALMERLFFSNYIYSIEIPTVFPKKLPSAYFYTMNFTKEQAAQFEMQKRLSAHEFFAERILGVKPKTLYAYNTVQFTDYTKYESSEFDGNEKLAYHEANFANQSEAAYQIGRSLMEQNERMAT